MARRRDENRDRAKQLFLDSDGTISNKEIAEQLDVSDDKVRKWKCIDKWKEALENRPKKRGGQRGNKNAQSHGAPQRNKNAQTHGAYSTVYFDELTEEEKKLIESITLDTEVNMLRELQTLIAKENDLKKRTAQLSNGDTGELYVDRVVEMRTPAGKDEKGKGPAVMETTVKSSAFERAMKLEAELNKIHGRIIKLLDSIKSYELEQRRISLEEKRYTLAKQKINGEYDIDPETNEINDTFVDEDGQDNKKEEKGRKRKVQGTVEKK